MQVNESAVELKSVVSIRYDCSKPRSYIYGKYILSEEIMVCNSNNYIMLRTQAVNLVRMFLHMVRKEK